VEYGIQIGTIMTTMICTTKTYLLSCNIAFCHKNCNFWHGFIGCKYAAIQITWLAEVYLV